MKKIELEQIALNLNALLTVISAADGDNIVAMQLMPIVTNIAADMAEMIYCTIADSRGCDMIKSEVK